MNHRPKLSLYQKIEMLPPFVVYALARLPTRSLKDKRPKLEQLAAAANIPVRTFSRIAEKLSWQDVTLGHLDRFCAACGVDLLRQNPHLEYLRHAAEHQQRSFTHLSTRQLRRFNKQCQAWRDSRMQQPAQS